MDGVVDDFWETQVNVWFDISGSSSWVECCSLIDVQKKSLRQMFHHRHRKVIFVLPKIEIMLFNPLSCVSRDARRDISHLLIWSVSWEMEMRRQNTKGLEGGEGTTSGSQHSWSGWDIWRRIYTRTAAFPRSSSLLSVSAGIFSSIFTVLLSSGTGERKNESETDGGRSTWARLSDCRETERWQDA